MEGPSGRRTAGYILPDSAAVPLRQPGFVALFGRKWRPETGFGISREVGDGASGEDGAL